MTIKEWYQIQPPPPAPADGMYQFTEALNIILLDISQRLGSIDTSSGTDFGTLAMTNLHLAGTLEVDGVTTLTGAVTLAGGLAVTGNITVTGTVDGIDIAAHTHEGTAILSTGEEGATKFLREDGDNSCSWQTAPGGSLWTDEATYYRPNNVTNDASDNFRIYDVGNITLYTTPATNIETLYVKEIESLATAGAFHFAQVIYNDSSGSGEREALHAVIESSANVAGRFVVGINGIGHIESGSGNAFGLNGYAWVDAAADADAECVGIEANTDVRGTVVRKVGLQVIDVSTSAAGGSSIDAGILIGDQGGSALGYQQGIQFMAGTVINNHIHTDDDFIMNVTTGNDYFWQVNDTNVASLTAEGSLTITGVYAGPGDNSSAFLRFRNNQDVGFFLEYSTSPDRLYFYEKAAGWIGYILLDVTSTDAPPSA